MAVRQEIGDRRGEAETSWNIGRLYQDQGDLVKAEEMHRKALELDQALGSKEGMANQYGNLGLVYEQRGNLDQAEELWRKSLNLFQAMGHPDTKKVQQLLDELAR